jgi:hypothetical protein
MPAPLKIDPQETIRDLTVATGSPSISADTKELLSDCLQTVESLLRQQDQLARERDIAIHEVSRWAAKAGEWQGRYETCQLAGIVEGWRERALHAEKELERLKT